MSQEPDSAGLDAGQEEEGEGLPLLVTLGHPRLAQRSAAVPLSVVRGAEFQDRLRLLERAMLIHRGIGIAAPQVGWFERFFLMGIAHESEGQEPRIELQAWINPEIVTASTEQGWAWEGCLSVPGLRGWIRRPCAVAVRGYDARGERISREYTGWPARVFQHEYDHLEGMLFPYRAADPRHIVTIEQLAMRESWPEDWPAPGAARAPFGEVMPEAACPPAR
jgi:peptide deformylase